MGLGYARSRRRVHWHPVVARPRVGLCLPPSFTCVHPSPTPLHHHPSLASIHDPLRSTIILHWRPSITHSAPRTTHLITHLTMNTPTVPHTPRFAGASHAGPGDAPAAHQAQCWYAVYAASLARGWQTPPHQELALPLLVPRIVTVQAHGVSAAKSTVLQKHMQAGVVTYMS